MSEPPDPWSDLERSHRDEHRPDEGQRYTDFEDTLEHNESWPALGTELAEDEQADEGEVDSPYAGGGRWAALSSTHQIGMQVDSALQRSPDWDAGAGGEEVCRVCRCGPTLDQPLFYPCMCKGSIRHVHQECLTQWLKHSNKSACELCKHSFKFRPVYAENAPRVLAGHELLVGLGKKVARSCQHMLRLTLICAAWLLGLPMGTSLIWRFYFSHQFNLSISYSDYIWGTFLSATLLTLVVLFFLLVDTVRGTDVEHPPEHGDNVVERLPNAGNIVNIENNENVRVHGGGNIGAVHGEAVPEPEEEGEDFLLAEFVGFEGSLKLLVIILALNAIALAVLALFPYWIGRLALQLSGFFFRHDLAEALLVTEEMMYGFPEQEFYASMKTVFIGYTLIVSHCLTWLAWLALTSGNQAYSLIKPVVPIFRFVCTFVKVASMLLVVLGIVPELCGWFLEVSSLPLLETTFDQHMTFWRAHPIISFTLHWAFGMMFMYNLSSTLQWLRTVLRQGVLWFVREPEDPHFDLLEEITRLPLLNQIRRACLSLVFFGAIIGVVIGIPLQLARRIPSMLPLNFFDQESYPVDLMVMYFIAPLLWKYANPKAMLKAGFLLWLRKLAEILELTSYLFPSEDPDNQQRPVKYPSFFLARIMVLLSVSTLMISSCGFLVVVVPLHLGRTLVALVGLGQISDIYAIVFGFAFLWVIKKGSFHTINQLQSIEKISIVDTMGRWACVFAKCAFLASFWLFVIPLLLSFLLESLILPISQPQTDVCPAPQPFLQRWVLGLVYLRLCHKLVMLNEGSEWKRRLRRAVANGYSNIEPLKTFTDIFYPICMWLGVALFVPHFVAVRVVPLVTSSLPIQNFCEHFSYHIVGLLCILWNSFQALCFWLVKMHDSIRDEKYLVGLHLQNCHRD